MQRVPVLAAVGHALINVHALQTTEHVHHLERSAKILNSAHVSFYFNRYDKLSESNHVLLAGL